MSVTPLSVESDVDLFSEQVLADPYPAYRHLRDIGPAGYLTRYGIWFLGRYDAPAPRCATGRRSRRTRASA
jgi:cytochrome P450